MNLDFDLKWIEGQPPQDAAAWIQRTLKDPVWRSMYKNVPSLRDVYPETSEAKLSEALWDASSLLCSAYFAADKGGGVEYLKKQHPGFSDKTYNMVHAYGLFQSR